MLFQQNLMELPEFYITKVDFKMQRKLISPSKNKMKFSLREQIFYHRHRFCK